MEDEANFRDDRGTKKHAGPKHRHFMAAKGLEFILDKKEIQRQAQKDAEEKEKLATQAGSRSPTPNKKNTKGVWRKKDQSSSIDSDKNTAPDEAEAKKKKRRGKN